MVIQKRSAHNGIMSSTIGCKKHHVCTRLRFTGMADRSCFHTGSNLRTAARNSGPYTHMGEQANTSFIVDEDRMHIKQAAFKRLGAGSETGDVQLLATKAGQACLNAGCARSFQPNIGESGDGPKVEKMYILSPRRLAIASLLRAVRSRADSFQVVSLGSATSVYPALRESK